MLTSYGNFKFNKYFGNEFAINYIMIRNTLKQTKSWRILLFLTSNRTKYREIIYLTFKAIYSMQVRVYNNMYTLTWINQNQTGIIMLNAQVNPNIEMRNKSEIRIFKCSRNSNVLNFVHLNLFQISRFGFRI
jgi:hypothetical protein